MRFRLPQVTVAPTFSICPRHGYLHGQHEFCLRCDAEAAAQRSRTPHLAATKRTRLPSITVMPTFSICPKHGHLDGAYEFCPRCDAERAAQEKRRPQSVAAL